MLNAKCSMQNESFPSPLSPPMPISSYKMGSPREGKNDAFIPPFLLQIWNFSEVHFFKLAMADIVYSNPDCFNGWNFMSFYLVEFKKSENSG
jgi:hypothetical protein